MSQGSSFLATLGFRPESLWDSVSEFPKGIRVRDDMKVAQDKPNAAWMLWLYTKETTETKNLVRCPASRERRKTNLRDLAARV